MGQRRYFFVCETLGGEEIEQYHFMVNIFYGVYYIVSLY